MIDICQVYGIVFWNVILALISCNVMIRSEEDEIGRHTRAKNYKSIEEEVFDSRNSIHEL